MYTEAIQALSEQAAVKLADQLGMKRKPSIFLLNGRVMNAFAVKLMRKRVVVLYSDIVEAMIEKGDRKQLEIILAHEFGHHALGHTYTDCHYFSSRNGLVS